MLLCFFICEHSTACWLMARIKPNPVKLVDVVEPMDWTVKELQTLETKLVLMESHTRKNESDSRLHFNTV